MRGMIEACCLNGASGFVYSSVDGQRKVRYGDIGLADSLTKQKGKMTVVIDSKRFPHWKKYWKLLLVNIELSWIKKIKSFLVKIWTVYRKKLKWTCHAYWYGVSLSLYPCIHWGLHSSLTALVLKGKRWLECVWMSFSCPWNIKKVMYTSQPYTSELEEQGLKLCSLCRVTSTKVIIQVGLLRERILKSKQGEIDERQRGGGKLRWLCRWES